MASLDIVLKHKTEINAFLKHFFFKLDSSFKNTSDTYNSRWFDLRFRQHYFVEAGYEIISTVTAILSLSLNKAGQLTVTGERMRT